MNREVEIIKIGQVLDYDTKTVKKTIMLVADGGKLIDYYIKIFKESSVSNDYIKLMANSDTFIRTYRRVSDVIKGVPDSDPIVGKRFTINNLMWGTSTVIVVLDDIFITRNSVYAIHDVSKIREKKLKELGI